MNSVSDLKQKITVFKNQDVILTFLIRSDFDLKELADISDFTTVTWKLVANETSGTILLQKTAVLTVLTSKAVVTISESEMSAIAVGNYVFILERDDTNNRYPLTGWTKMVVLAGPPS